MVPPAPPPFPQPPTYPLSSNPVTHTRPPRTRVALELVQEHAAVPQLFHIARPCGAHVLADGVGGVVVLPQLGVRLQIGRTGGEGAPRVGTHGRARRLWH